MPGPGSTAARRTPTEPRGIRIGGLGGGNLGEVGLRCAQRRVPEVQRRGVHQKRHHARKVLHDVPIKHLPQKLEFRDPQRNQGCPWQLPVRAPATAACTCLPPMHAESWRTTQALETDDNATPMQLLHPLTNSMCTSLCVCMRTQYSAHSSNGSHTLQQPARSQKGKRMAVRACWIKRWKALRRAWRSRRCRCRFRIICSAAPAGGSLNATSSAFTTSRCAWQGTGQALVTGPSGELHGFMRA